MNLEHFTPKELFDILHQELQPQDEDEYTKIFQMVGFHALRSGKFEVASVYQHSGYFQRRTISSNQRFTIKNTNVALYSTEQHFSVGHKALLNILGVTLIEKNKSLLIMSDARLHVSHNYAWVNGQLIDAIDIEFPQGRFQLLTSDSSDTMFDRLRAILGDDTIRDLQKKIEHTTLQQSYNALSATKPRDSFITDCLPLLVLHQILKEEDNRT